MEKDWCFGCTVKKSGTVHSDVLWRGRNEHDLKGSDRQKPIGMDTVAQEEGFE